MQKREGISKHASSNSSGKGLLASHFVTRVGASMLADPLPLLHLTLHLGHVMLNG